jgi:formate hydrogenlyase subunit 3/multisubunit Na+/H+ antiporter MnhD subunit
MMASLPTAANCLALVVFWPMLAALFVVLLARAAPRLIPAFMVAATGLTLLGVIALTATVLDQQRLAWSIPALVGRFELVADAFSMIFALVAALVWFSATLYSIAYLSTDPARNRFHISSLVVLAAYLGVVLAGDLMTLFVCFELLGLVALLLVVHDGSDKARRAGVKYFWMTLLGGFSLLAGILLIHALAGTTSIAPLPLEGASPGLVWAAFILLLIGFGVKAGMVPLHTWLPDAHPAAPAPASALLSGVMIKAGAYGVFRMLQVLFRPESGGEIVTADIDLHARLGMIVVWMGIATMLIGVTLALGQHHAKRMLAWHSVSQMGFVLTGLGAGAWLGAEGAMGTGGGLFHVVNHALFKASLFLGMGAVAVYAGTADMYRLGGLWRRMPVIFVCMLIAAAGITGIPLFNGFVSKCMIHHALVDGAARPGGQSLLLAEWLFILTCAGTVASFVKLIGLVFVRQPEQPLTVARPKLSPLMPLAMIVLSIPVIGLGLRPEWLLDGLMVPGFAMLELSTAPIERYMTAYFLSRADLVSFASMLVGGVVIYKVGMHLHLFGLAAPAWLGVDYWYRRAATGFVSLCTCAGGRLGQWRARWAAAAWKFLLQLNRSPARPLNLQVRLLQTLQDLLQRGGQLFDLPGHWLDRFSVRLSAGSGQRAIANVRYRKLERQRDEFLAAALREVHARFQRSGQIDAHRLEHKLNATRQIAGLVANRWLERAMGIEVLSPDRALSPSSGFDKEPGKRQVMAVADAAEGWLAGQGIEPVLRQVGFGWVLEPIPESTTTDWQDWSTELRELLFRPAARRWPLSEDPDRGALLAGMRRILHITTRDPGPGLVLIVVMVITLALLLAKQQS